MLIYLSHSDDSHEHAQRVADFLEKQGYRVWRASEDILPGMICDTQVERALGRALAMVVILTRGLREPKWRLGCAPTCETSTSRSIHSSSRKSPRSLAISGLPRIEGRGTLERPASPSLRTTSFGEGL